MRPKKIKNLLPSFGWHDHTLADALSARPMLPLPTPSASPSASTRGPTNWRSRRVADVLGGRKKLLSLQRTANCHHTDYNCLPLLVHFSIMSRSRGVGRVNRLGCLLGVR